MKTLTVVFLFAVLCMERASLLRYYTCQNETYPSASLFTRECLESERHCMAVYNRTSDRKPPTSKWSAQKCPKIKETGIKVVRCEDNYCNRIGPSSRSPSCATLIMVTLALSMVTLAAIMVTLATFYILHQINP